RVDPANRYIARCVGGGEDAGGRVEVPAARVVDRFLDAWLVAGIAEFLRARLDGARTIRRIAAEFGEALQGRLDTPRAVGRRISRHAAEVRIVGWENAHWQLLRPHQRLVQVLQVDDEPRRPPGVSLPGKCAPTDRDTP